VAASGWIHRLLDPEESMDASRKTLVQQSWRSVEPIADAAATLFYARLFQLDPDLRKLFHSTDFQEQKRKLMQTLALVVGGLDHMDTIGPSLEALGRRHEGYGVRDSHYATVGEALLWTLAQGLGDAFTPQVRAAWEETYGLVAAVMRRPAAVAELPTPPLPASGSP
jgi:hemoglobin-like flavoprotein